MGRRPKAMSVEQPTQLEKDLANDNIIFEESFPKGKKPTAKQLKNSNNKIQQVRAEAKAKMEALENIVEIIDKDTDVDSDDEDLPIITPKEKNSSDEEIFEGIDEDIKAVNENCQFPIRKLMKKNDWEVFYLELIEAKKYLDYVINSIEVKDIVKKKK